MIATSVNESVNVPQDINHIADEQANTIHTDRIKLAVTWWAQGPGRYYTTADRSPRRASI